MVRTIGRYVPNIALGCFDGACEIAGLPVVEPDAVVRLLWVSDDSGGEMLLEQTEYGHQFRAGDLAVMARGAVQAYISIAGAWKSRAFYISIAPMPLMAITPSLSPEDIDARLMALNAPEEEPWQEPEEASGEPSLEERNRADIDYLAMMMVVTL